jgi:hypothetical protein
MPVLRRNVKEDLRAETGARANREPVHPGMRTPEPFLPGRSLAEEWESPRGLPREVRPGRHGILETCSNPGCGTGWLHLWRSRSAPVFEGGWSCSAGCTEARIQAAVARELDGRAGSPRNHRHRVPLGLVMLEQGWIAAADLRLALEAQRTAGTGRLGEWLVRRGVGEQLVTRALGLQWSCPVLPLEFHDAEAMTWAMPRLFVDAFGALPLRVAAGRLLYLGFEDRIDPVLALAVERMTGLRVECGLVRGSEFLPAHARMLGAGFPPVELIEAASEPALVRALGRSIERARPVEARLVRVHDCLWLRMWRPASDRQRPGLSGVADIVCSLGLHQNRGGEA